MADARRFKVGDLDLTIIDPFERDIQYIYDEIFVGHVYEHPHVKLGAKPVIMDVGANVGLYAIWAARKYKPHTLLAYEASPTTHTCTADNMARHIGDDVAIAKSFNFAVSREAGRDLILNQPPWNSGLSTVLDGKTLPWVDELKSKGELHQHKVRSTSISHEMKLHNLLAIDVLKVDVEGHFMEVLEGVFDADWPRIRNVVLEAEYTETLGHTKASLAAWLKAKGYAVETRDGAQVLVYAWR